MRAPSAARSRRRGRHGEPFHPLPWHRFVIGSLFDWRRDSGRMRFRSGWLETGVGQAKSPLMGWAGIPRSQILAIGQDKATADALFGDAVAMCRPPPRPAAPDQARGSSRSASVEPQIGRDRSL